MKKKIKVDQKESIEAEDESWRNKPKRRVYDWEKLKHEFMTGNWPSLVEFQRQKGLKNTSNAKFRGWVREREEFQKKMTEEVAKKAIQREMDEAADVRIRQARLSRFLQAKGAEKLKNAKQEDISIEEARKLTITGMEQERKALGLDGNNGGGNYTQVNINSRTNFDKLIEGLDYEGLLEFIAKIKRERTRRTLQEGVIDSTGEIQDGEVI